MKNQVSTDIPNADLLNKVSAVAHIVIRSTVYEL